LDSVRAIELTMNVSSVSDINKLALKGSVPSKGSISAIDRNREQDLN